MKPVIGLFPAHPAQVWMLRALAAELAADAVPLWMARSKDITIDLMRSLGIEPVASSRAGTGLRGNLLEYGRNLLACLRRGRGIDLWISKYGPVSMAAWLMRRPSISFNDDDADVVPLIAWTSYPFARFTLTPRSTRMRGFERRALRYDGYHELFYLHPARFAADASIHEELGLARGAPYGIVRLSALSSHHDGGIRGVGDRLLREVLARCGSEVRVFITSEKPLPPDLEPYRYAVAPTRIHHALAHARFVLGDSQTMTAEAAVLGIPALRINDFVGRISYIADLEHAGLAFGFRPGEEAALLRKLEEVLASDRAEFGRRREALLAATIDPVPWFAGIVRMTLAGAPQAVIRAWAEENGRASLR